MYIRAQSLEVGLLYDTECNYHQYLVRDFEELHMRKMGKIIQNMECIIYGT
jgi:hypothetical protein